MSQDLLPPQEALEALKRFPGDWLVFRGREEVRLGLPTEACMIWRPLLRQWCAAFDCRGPGRINGNANSLVYAVPRNILTAATETSGIVVAVSVDARAGKPTDLTSAFQALESLGEAVKELRKEVTQLKTPAPAKKTKKAASPSSKIDAIRANADKLKGRWLGLEELMLEGDVVCNFQNDFEARQTPEALRGAYMMPGGWTGCPRSELYGRHPVFRPKPALKTQLKNLRNS